METLIRVLIAGIVLLAGLFIGLGIRPSGIYSPQPCHYTAQHSCR